MTLREQLLGNSAVPLHAVALEERPFIPVQA